MENLVTLRVEIVQQLLVICQSVKVKRLFMYMSEKCGHPWVSEIDTQSIYLGKGKRMVVQGGMYDKKYHITVPRNYYREASE
jgi:hypothetical protein